METLEHKVVDMKGKEVGTIGLDPAIFGAKVNRGLVHKVVRWQLAKRRSGTHSALTRSMMEKSNHKPWKQKGTGRARAGSVSSPVWVGGAVSHGPLPRKYDFRLNKKERRNAIASVLSTKLRDGSIVIVDQLAINSGKTRDMAQLLNTLGVDGQKVLLVLPADQYADAANGVVRAARNLPNVTIRSVEGANVYEMVNYKYLVSTREGIAALQERARANGVSE